VVTLLGMADPTAVTGDFHYQTHGRLTPRLLSLSKWLSFFFTICKLIKIKVRL
jgi:hypothetical protein